MPQYIQNTLCVCVMHCFALHRTGVDGGESPTPDDKTFKYLAKIYANTHEYMSQVTFTPLTCVLCVVSVGSIYPFFQGEGLCEADNFAGGVTNGAAWYIVRGGMQVSSCCYTYVDCSTEPTSYVMLLYVHLLAC